ncbi:helix-turn-helix domain-containing protein [Acidobacteria bacterium AH-259-D05]|nr:helix-turn-helix domain-containing protein [Acidobacteria bacterium AH-259-D05]
MIGKPMALLQVPNQRLFGTKAAAKYLNVHPDSLRKYADLGWIKARRLERRRVFTLEDLDAFIDALPDYQSYEYTATSGKPGGKEIGNGS